VKSPVSTRQKQCEPGEDASLCIFCIALHSLHARLHSTPHDQASARCGQWAAGASQEAACLLTTVGAAVKQAKPGKRDCMQRAGSERPSSRKNEAANRAPPGGSPAAQSPTKPARHDPPTHCHLRPTQPSANDSSRHIRGCPVPCIAAGRLALAPRQLIAADFRGKSPHLPSCANLQFCSP